MALSTHCRFCTESGQFYKQLTQQPQRSVRLIAVFPEPAVEGQRYLSGLGVAADEISQSPLEALGVSATPTLILTNDQGAVIDSWRGRLTADKEAEVLSKLK